MPRLRNFIPVIVASLISGIVGPILIHYPLSDPLMSLDESGAYNIILFISPILIAIWISLISGYMSTNFESGDKPQYNEVWSKVFLSTTWAYILTSTLTRYYIPSQPYTSTDPGLEFVGLCFIIPITIALPALFNGLLLASFFIIGMWTKYYKYVKNQRKRFG